MRYIFTWWFAFLLCTGCYYGDLSVHGKKCSNRTGDERTCPSGFVCVESPISVTEVTGNCYEESSAVPCHGTFCDTDQNWVIECQSDGYSTRVKEDCSNLKCNPDTAHCAISCESGDMDCPQGEGEQTCDVGTHLCRSYQDCLRCAPNPNQDVTATETPHLDCFYDPINPPPVDPATCTLTGRTYFFPKKNSLETVGLEVVLRPAGEPETELKSTTVVATPCVTTPGDCGIYEFTDVETNRAYDVEIRAPEEGWDGTPVVGTTYAGITIRADRLSGDLFSLALNVMMASTYESYTSGIIDNYDNRRGLLIGRALDCGSGEIRQALGNVKVGLAIPPASPGRIYYFPEGAVLAPDLGLSATTKRGYYMASGVPACRNQIGFAAMEMGTRLELGTVSFTMRPGSVVIIDSPHRLDTMLP